MAGLFATLAIRKALDKLSSILPARSLLASSSSAAAMVRQGQEQDLEDLRMLERTMHRIHATLKDAEQHWDIRDESAKLRLKELKELAYDAEDVVDEYEYEVNRCKAEALQLSASVASHKRKWQQEVTLSFPTTSICFCLYYTSSVRKKQRNRKLMNIYTHTGNLSMHAFFFLRKSKALPRVY
jgi:hypothetical protein